MKKEKKFKKTGLLLGLVFIMLLGACPNGGDKDFDLAGTYSFDQGGIKGTFVFKTDNTYEISRVNLSVKNTGKWTVSGDEVKITTDAVTAGSVTVQPFTESFKITSSGNNITLTLKASSISNFLTSFSVTTASNMTSLTLTKQSGGSNEEESGSVRQVSAIGSMTVAIKKDGTLWAWGSNYDGQLGDGTTTDRTTPTKIGNETNWASVSAGTVAFKTDGTLWAWGGNFYGRIGDGTSGAENYKTTPTKVGNETNWASVSTSDHTVAIKTDGTLWAWGSNSHGQLGDGTSGGANYKTTPTKVGNETNWASVSAGGGYTVAIKKDGTLWAWGYNYNGNLGDGTTTYRYTPTKIGNETNWASVSARVGTTLAIKTDGTLWAWGSNWDGQFGDGTKTDRTTPTKIGNETNWASVSVGTRHTVAIKTDGTLWAWGFNWDRQLGDDTLQPSYTPKKIGNETNWASVSAGMHHTVALKTGGTLWAWGSNYYGQLGDGTTTDRTPIQIILPE